jgi:hypothetical protein
MSSLLLTIVAPSACSCVYHGVPVVNIDHALKLSMSPPVMALAMGRSKPVLDPPSHDTPSCQATQYGTWITWPLPVS